MVKIRLTRIGAKKDPHYRLIAIPVRSKRDTKALEIFGYYNPKSKEFKYDKDKLDYWRKNGAQITETVIRLLGEKPQKDYSKNKRILEKKKAKETETKDIKEKAEKKEVEKEKKATDIKPETENKIETPKKEN